MEKMTLRAARVNAGKSAEDVCAIMMISEATLYSWENGYTSPKWPVFMKLCRLYEVDPRAISLPEESAKSEQTT